MATGNIPSIVIGTEAPDYAQGMVTDVNDGINRINLSLGSLTTDIADLQATVDDLHAADIVDFDTAVRTNRLDQMTAPAADLSANSHKITNLADASSATDALNRQTADARYIGAAGGEIDAPLKFGQGTSDNPAQAAVDGGVFYAATGIAYVSISNTFDPCLFLNNNSSTSVALFYSSASPVGGISVSFAGTSFDTTSDYRLKEDLEPMIAPLARLKALRPLSFHWKADETRAYKTDGFLANEVQKIVPGAVRGEMDATTYQTLDYSRLVPLLIGAVQELNAKVEQLEQRVGA